MMIGPSMQNGIVINLENDIISSSYIHLTRQLMVELGIPVDFSGKRIQIPFHPYRGKDMKVEGDWTAASYWYCDGGSQRGNKPGNNRTPQREQPG